MLRLTTFSALRRAVLALFTMSMLSAFGCSPEKKAESCSDASCADREQPDQSIGSPGCARDCASKACGSDDGCGGKCACPDDLVHNAHGELVPASECRDTCQTAGFQCGEVCGQNCGGCGEDQVCGTTGQCECKPVCDGSSCSDGCGGTCDCGAGKACEASNKCVAEAACTDSCESTGRTCGQVCGASCGSCEGTESCVGNACVEGVSCPDCPLQARLIDRVVQNGALTEVTLAIEYVPTDASTSPRIADFRLSASAGAELMDVQPGEGLTGAGKDLYVDPASGGRFRKRADGTYQMLAYGFSGAQGFAAGRLATLRFKATQSGPLSFTLARRAQTFAPAEADAELQASNYDRPLVVSP